MGTILEKDRDIHFPNFSVLKASAGSGKTRSLTERFVQFLLSERIAHNGLRNILAITFSNNAARQMKGRILLWLKLLYLGDPETLDELSRLTSMNNQKVVDRAGRLIEEILHNYSDFQVKTIDSFMTAIFKSSAIDFGYNPEFDMLMNNAPVLKYSFDLFLRNVREGAEEAELFGRIVSDILRQKKGDAAYLWDPVALLLEETGKLYGKLSLLGKEPLIDDFSGGMSELEGKMRALIERIEDARVRAGLQKRSNSSYLAALTGIREGRMADLIGKGVINPPVNKPKKTDSSIGAFEEILVMWAEFRELLNAYTAHYIRSCYVPYLKVYERFKKTVDGVKRRQGKVFIEDINWRLAEYLDRDIVPDIYFRIGERIFHFLIDEFQDTSPIQWRNLSPLMENSLSQGGSVFVVGDTKQAIYGFRDADYTIMKTFEAENPFPSAKHSVQELAVNYRSLPKILEFNEKVFKEIVGGEDKYRHAGSQSGLTDYAQRARDGVEDTGYAEVEIVERHDEAPRERGKIQELIAELRGRGYRYKDIAILTQRNDDAVRATSWLNEKGIRFISHSSLDIRSRKVTGELVSLLYFLDSPMDSHYLSTFLLGDIFSRVAAGRHPAIDRQSIREFIFVHRSDSPLYKSFQEEFPVVWEEYFSGLFKSAGYLPLYDLISEIFSVFRLFEVLADEEATLVRILEVVKDFEGEGYNSLRDFLEFTGKGEAVEMAWNMSVPKGIDAVQVMTIHKAKGLGFPVVIILLYEERNRGFEHIVEEVGDCVRLLRITCDTSACHPDIERLYSRESLKEKVNRLNSLYVGFTRPQEELYVIGVKGKRGGYPFDVLPAVGYLPAAKPARSVTEQQEQEDFVVSHRHGRMVFRTVRGDAVNMEERKRGEYIHRILSLVDYTGEGLHTRLRLIIEKVTEEQGLDHDRDEETAELILGFLRSEDISGYFRRKPGRDARNEQEFSDGNGNLFRMDRVVIDGDRITVLDYKTGEDRAGAKHEAQMRTYMKILKEIHPDVVVEGVIGYVDLGEVRRVR